MKIKVSVEGLAACDKALGQLKASTAKSVLRRVGKRALQPVDDAWRQKAPHLTGALEKSGSVGSKLTKTQRAEHERESFVEVFAGPGPLAQAIQQEFGNQFDPPQPFMRPAWEENKDRVLEIVRQDLGAEIQRTAERVAKKALKLGSTR